MAECSEINAVTRPAVALSSTALFPPQRAKEDDPEICDHFVLALSGYLLSCASRLIWSAAPSTATTSVAASRLALGG